MGYKAYKLRCLDDLSNPFLAMYFGAAYVCWLSNYGGRCTYNSNAEMLIASKIYDILIPELKMCLCLLLYIFMIWVSTYLSTWQHLPQELSLCLGWRRFDVLCMTNLTGQNV